MAPEPIPPPPAFAAVQRGDCRGASAPWEGAGDWNGGGGVRAGGQEALGGGGSGQRLRAVTVGCKSRRGGGGVAGSGHGTGGGDTVAAGGRPGERSPERPQGQLRAVGKAVVGPALAVTQRRAGGWQQKKSSWNGTDRHLQRIPGPWGHPPPPQSPLNPLGPWEAKPHDVPPLSPS